MEKHTEKIRKFSKAVYVLLQVAFVALIVTGALEAFAWIVKAGRIPVLFEFGSVTVTLPHFVTDGIMINGSTYHFGIVGVVRTAMTIVIVCMAKNLFKKLRIDGSPFRADIVAGLRSLSCTLLFVGLFAGLNSFIAAGVVWVLCMIFDYGCALQNESDTTL